MRENLECKLLAYANSDAYAFHMPGHKRLLDPIREYAENKSWCVASANSEIVAFPADNQKRGKLRKTGRDENGKFGCVMEDEAAANRLLQLDITEIDGFDNLHDAQGILRDEMKKAAEMYGARDTLFSVNGSTCAL
ncbi:MAG: hypothetical protein Q4A32_11890, partial [Lachnospiraceae bacterium]|nr:hypothetical protein [Lachnospiraceae bacterium]